MRLFFALWPPPDLAHRLHEWAAAVRVNAGGRAIKSASIHLTLAFLGEQSPDRCALAAAVASSVAGASPAGVPFALDLDAPGYFRHNRIAWVGPSNVADRLSGLAGSLEQALREAGFNLERRAFSPHVTLLRGAREPHPWPPLPVLSWLVREVVLVESLRDNRGARYAVRERFALDAA